MKAVGIHVFAGGFSVGIQQAGFELDTHLETHGFAADTARKWTGVEVVNVHDGGFDVPWPDVEAELCFGNPRCTGFSCITSGYADETHGAWAKQTIDIHQFCRYGIKQGYPFIIWESVQQAFSTGRELLNYLRDELFVPANYRIAHLLLNAGSFGNAQRRRRYFFVAYKDAYRFNVEPPPFVPSAVVYDAIWDLRDRDVYVLTDRDNYDFDTHINLSPEEWHIIPRLPNGWCLNSLARYDYDALPEKYQITWDTRVSDMPFSLHCPSRIQWRCPAPTLHSSSGRLIHPWHNRPLTFGELARIMGLPDIPAGRDPVAQMAKGVVPAVGQWLGQQVVYSANHAWGQDDFESNYNHHTGQWVGRDTTGAVEKTFNLTHYVYEDNDDVRFSNEARIPRHRFNVDGCTGGLVRPWKAIAQSYREHNGDSRLGRLAEHISPEDLAD